MLQLAATIFTWLQTNGLTDRNLGIPCPNIKEETPVLCSPISHYIHPSMVHPAKNGTSLHRKLHTSRRTTSRSCRERHPYQPQPKREQQFAWRRSCQCLLCFQRSNHRRLQLHLSMRFEERQRWRVQHWPHSAGLMRLLQSQWRQRSPSWKLGGKLLRAES